MPYAEAEATQSLVYRMVERVRFLLNEPETDARWSDAYLLGEAVQPAFVQVMSRLALNQDQAVVMRYSFTVAANQEYYDLPPGVRTVLFLGKMSTEKRMTADWVPGFMGALHGVGWALHGRRIQFNPVPTQDDDEPWVVWYIPSGDFRMLYSTGGQQVIADGERVFRLGSSITLGSIDRRTNAYAGGLLRVIGQSGYAGPLQELLIESSEYSVSRGWTVTVAQDFSPSIAGLSNIRYELVPEAFPIVWKAVAEYAAIDLGVPRDLTEKQMRHLHLARDTTMKTLYDDASNLQGRIGKFFKRATFDNTDRTFGELTQRD